jgi:hypothetical protein
MTASPALGGNKRLTLVLLRAPALPTLPADGAELDLLRVEPTRGAELVRPLIDAVPAQITTIAA